MVVHVDRSGAYAGRVSSRLAVVGLVRVHLHPPRPVVSTSMLAATSTPEPSLLAGWNFRDEPYRRLPAACNTPLEWLSGT